MYPDGRERQHEKGMATPRLLMDELYNRERMRRCDGCELGEPLSLSSGAKIDYFRFRELFPFTWLYVVENSST